MSTAQKLEILKEVYDEEPTLDRVLDKLLEGVLAEYQRRRHQYEQTLKVFEERYQMPSAVFYERFEAGELGDATDFFEWAGLFELYQEVLAKIRRLEQFL